MKDKLEQISPNPIDKEYLSISEIAEQWSKEIDFEALDDKRLTNADDLKSELLERTVKDGFAFYEPDSFFGQDNFRCDNIKLCEHEAFSSDLKEYISVIKSKYMLQLVFECLEGKRKFPDEYFKEPFLSSLQPLNYWDGIADSHGEEILGHAYNEDYIKGCKKKDIKYQEIYWNEVKKFNLELFNLVKISKADFHRWLRLERNKNLIIDSPDAHPFLQGYHVLLPATGFWGNCYSEQPYDWRNDEIRGCGHS